MNLMNLKMSLETAWSKETSALPEQWSKENPARGQCAVSALVIQDHLGGDLLRGTVNGESHYWNRLPSGKQVDWTFSQFGTGPHTVSEPIVRERSYVLKFAPTVTRYEVLKAAVQAQATE